jgi:hypothetical protein
MTSIDLVSLHKEFSKMQKQVSEMVKYMSAAKQRVSNEKVASRSVSTTRSTTDETPYYHDEYLNRLTAVVGNANEEAQHDPLSRHTSSEWKSNIVKYDKILQVPDRNHINTYSCIARLLLHFYERIQDTQEHHAVNETIELVLSFFADIQARLQYPSSPDIDSKISVCVRASRRLRSTGLGSIQGIPSEAPELTDMITCLEKLAEESFRSIYKEGVKTTRSVETDDFDIEHKTFSDKIRTLDNERQRLEKLCHDRHIDTRTRRQKDRDKEREQAADDTSRNNSRQWDAPD